MTPHPKFASGVFFNRVIDGDPPSGGKDNEHDGATDSQPRKAYGAADDSFAAGAAQHGTAGSFTRTTVHRLGRGVTTIVHEPDAHEAGGDSGNDPTVDGDAEAKLEIAAQKRLLKVNQRQTSGQWVVLDRASVLHKLLAHPEGLTLVRLAELLLGKNASPRDTRRLSAMMKREEIRETVTRAGRGQAIKLTPTGASEVKKLDVAAERAKSVQIRQERVQRQQQRLQRALGVTTVETGDPATERDASASDKPPEKPAAKKTRRTAKKGEGDV